MKKKEKLTEVVDVLGVKFEVEYKNSIKDTDNSALSGECDSSRHQIHIALDENKTTDRIERTLLHEVIHAILYVSGQSNSIGNMKREESIVLALENGLHSLYKRRSI